MRFLCFAGWAVWLAAIATPLSSNAQTVDGVEVVQSRLVADKDAVVPGKTVRVGLVMELAEQWHTYWQYSGDSGLATQIEWILPDGVVAGPVQWPVPVRYVEAGDLQVYSFFGKYMLVSEITVPPDFPGSDIVIGARATWLVCKEECIPGGANLEIRLPVAANSGPANAGLFSMFERSLPDRSPPPYEVQWRRGNGEILIEINGLPAGVEADWYPLPPPSMVLGHPRPAVADDSGFARVSIPFQAGEWAPLPGLLVVVEPDGKQHAWEMSAPAGGGSPNGAIDSPATQFVPFGGEAASFGWGRALLFGFLGGIILNLMPCVLPVISLKIFGFIKQAGEAPAKIFRLGLTFVAGIFAWFGLLALGVVTLKLLGQEVNWAFQFQSPYFMLFMSVVVFVFALNLFGVFEITLPGGMNNRALDLANREGYTGTFFHGVFATILATPCTAPFLGQALGFAFSQPAPMVFVMFFSIAAGMGAPFVVLAAKPGWMKYLPKPGIWMEQLKQFLGFLLIATLLWLLWVIGHQGGVAAVIWAGALLLFLSVACWILGTFGKPTSTARARRTTLVVCAAVSISGFLLFIPGRFHAAVMAGPQPAASVTDANGIQWIPFSDETLRELLSGDQTIFIDFTAEWCLTCKANKRLAIDVPATRAVIEELNIAMVVADWTNQNSEIGDFLKKFGRVGVPFYVIYPRDRSRAPITLGEALRPSMVIDALRHAHGEPISDREAAAAREGDQSQPAALRTRQPSHAP